MSLTTFIINQWFYHYYRVEAADNPSWPFKLAFIKIAVFILSYIVCVIIVLKVFKNVVYRVNLLSLSLETAELSESNTMYEVELTNTKKQMYGPIDLFVSILTPFILMSSFSFGLCAGSGMAFFPIELLDKYIYRPKLMNAAEYITAKKVLINESNQVIKKAKMVYELERDLTLINPNEKKKVQLKQSQLESRKFEAKRAFIEFEEMQDMFLDDENVSDSNPIVYYTYLLAGVVGSVISALFLMHTFVSINGIVGILEYILINIESSSWPVCICFFFLLLLYIGICLLHGSCRMSKIMRRTLDTHPFKANRTYTDSFFLHINICLCGFLGMMLYLVRYTPKFMRFVQFDLFFNRIIVRTWIIHYFYRFKIFEYIFVLSFFISIFVSFFISNGAFNLRQKIMERMKEIELEKTKLGKMEKDPTNKLLLL